ncbi:hypothetical protein BJ322DRAFT_1104420 [Thelephora terrestris]|uniref:Uncharacterized protein n=1 Tax=Thelephora terrestris TaxID=56493 RepID=A0A9P6HMG1_9AGAM|nr:hypothetical protein BJ322DRAFT_1104420 [Thelephora terrestris]
MPVLRVHPTGEIEDGTTEGYIFRSQRHRRLPIHFKTIVPLAETFENPRYIRIKDEFSQPIAGNEIHDCKVIVDKNVFLITAYWKEDGQRNMAVESVGKGLRWKGEIAVVQVGKFTPFYKHPKNPSSVNKAIARFVTEFTFCTALSKPCPTHVDMDD